ncbi:crotonase/enoyl-CoA hydratase family protein [Planotetraspora sp. GP83]|uniref:crotonase/enoyl-CoA hydratase family protein n=1 Tax=Planotetraspora sp. GP83 TaxID=3156264 RepID=UPI003511020C
METPANGSSAAEAAATLERRGHVALITLNRPSALNAVNAALSTAVGAAMETLEKDPDLRVGVITGAGRAFCAGADLKEIAAGRSTAADGHPEWGFAGLIKRFVSKPIIAAVNGFALGGGTEIVLACDLVVASEQATFGLPEVKRGLMAAGGGLIRMPRQIPFKIAVELALTGDPISAETARQLGLVNRVVAAERTVAAAIELAEAIAANAPLSVVATKRMLYRNSEYGSDLDPRLWELNDDEMSALVTSADAAEGTRAFAEKRLPGWTGR